MACCKKVPLSSDSIFLKKFWIFSESRTAEFSYNNFSNVYSSAIDQFKYSHFVCLPKYINIMHVFQCVRGFARGGGGGGNSA